MEYQLEGNIFSFGGQSYIKNGKSSKIPDGTYYLDDVNLVFSGNNLIERRYGSISEQTYEFVVGYEKQGIRKGYLLVKFKDDASAVYCVFEKDKLTLRGTTYTKR